MRTHIQSTWIYARYTQIHPNLKDNKIYVQTIWCYQNASMETWMNVYFYIYNRTYEELEKKTGVKYFDICLMDPLYSNK